MKGSGRLARVRRWWAGNGGFDMSSSIANSHANAPRLLPDTAKGAQAKHDGRKPDTAPESAYMALIGAAIQRAVRKVGWSNKEAAAKVGVDDAEFGKWLSGNRRPHFDKLMALDALRWPLICALADCLEVAEEIVTLKKKAG